MEKVGKDGVITDLKSLVEWRQNWKSLKEMQFDRGYLSQYMVTDNEKWWQTLKSIHFDHRQEDFKYPRNLCHCWKAFFKANRPPLIIADDVDGEALPTLVLNKILMS